MIWVLASKTGVLSDDPMLWFALMLMPAGPPAMILVPLSDVNGSPESERMAIAKVLTVGSVLGISWMELIECTDKLCNYAVDLFCRCR